VPRATGDAAFCVYGSYGPPASRRRCIKTAAAAKFVRVSLPIYGLFRANRPKSTRP